MTVSSKALKKDIFAAYVEAENEIELLKKEINLLQRKKADELITARQYVQDISNRAEIHNQEINLLRQDLIQLINWIVAQMKKVRTVELPQFIK
jgi:hypothetical protein